MGEEASEVTSWLDQSEWEEHDKGVLQRKPGVKLFHLFSRVCWSTFRRKCSMRKFR